MKRPTPKKFAELTGGRIRAARRAAGLTILSLSERTGLCSSFISDAERGVRGTSLHSTVLLCRALGIRIEELVHED